MPLNTFEASANWTPAICQLAHALHTQVRIGPFYSEHVKTDCCALAGAKRRCINVGAEGLFEGSRVGLCESPSRQDNGGKFKEQNNLMERRRAVKKTKKKQQHGLSQAIKGSRPVKMSQRLKRRR